MTSLPQRSGMGGGRKTQIEPWRRSGDLGRGSALAAGYQAKPSERVVPATDQIPIGSGNAPLFALLAERTTATTGLLTKFAGLLDPDIRPPVRADTLWLARPDGYVACSSSDTKVIVHYLDDVIRPHAVAA